MARVGVEVRPSARVGSYSLFVDGLPVTIGVGGRGAAACVGRCGDGSRHALLYSFNGPPGSTISITLGCSAHIVCRLDLAIPDDGPPWRAGREVFVI